MSKKQNLTTVRVGLGIFIFHENKILLMKRKGILGNDTWAPPGGKIEMGETFFECAKREAYEEIGIHIKDCTIIGITNDIFSPDAHYVTIHTRVTHYSNQPTNKEPDKCSGLEWFALDNLPNPLFLPLYNLLKNDPTVFEQQCLVQNNHSLYNNFYKKLLEENMHE